MPDHGFASIKYGLPAGWLCPGLPLAVVASSGDVRAPAGWTTPSIAQASMAMRPKVMRRSMGSVSYHRPGAEALTAMEEQARER